MPLLVPASPDAPLTQGDLLWVGPLHLTGHDGKPVPRLEAEIALVLSRDCVAAHKGKVVVAHVVAVSGKLFDDKALKEDLKKEGAKSYDVYARLFDDLVRLLQEKRDGSLSPDRFYLGPQPGAQARLVAQLDELSTVELPKDSAALAQWVSTQRVATLSDDARRALGTRIFWAFTRVGFDDHEWLPDPDLRAVCDAGELARNALQTAISEAKALLHNDEAATVDGKRLDGRKKEIVKLEQELAHLNARLEGFLAERMRRDGAAE
jgi:hypothetical protein